MLANLGRNILKLSSSRFVLTTKINSLSSQSDINKSLYSLSDEELQMKETGK
jgi:hypothetical protein